MKKRSKARNGSVISVVVILGILILSQLMNNDTTIVNTDYSSKSGSDLITTGTIVEDSDGLAVYFFDVGQADSILITSNGETMLIDAGNNSDGKLVVSQLSNMGIKKIDYLVGTHPHEDHIGGLDDVIDSFEIGQIFMPKVSANTKTFSDVLDAIENKGLKVTAPEVGYTFRVGEASLEVMSITEDSDNKNLSSIVVELNYGDVSFLFMGDAETENEESREWNDINVLKVGHHGSSTSSSQGFLDEVKPEVSIIMVGKDNDYNHPNDGTLRRLNNITSNEVYRTDTDGTIIITSDGKKISIQKSNICLNGGES